MKGGKREGAGRPRSPAHLKKNPVNLKLPQWLIDWTGDQPKSRAVLIEQALIEKNKLEPPK